MNAARELREVTLHQADACSQRDEIQAEGAMGTITVANLAPAIRAEHEAARAAVGSAVAHAIRAGELLLEAKFAVGHGAFGSWLAANELFSERTARAYMQLAGLDPEKRQRVADMSLRKALQSIAGGVHTAVDDSWLLQLSDFGLPLEVARSFGGLLPDGRVIAVYEASPQWPGYWFVEVGDLERHYIDGMRRPILPSGIGMILRYHGVPSDMVWHWNEKDWPTGAFWDASPHASNDQEVHS